MTGDRLALGQDRHCDVVAEQPLGSQEEMFDQPAKRRTGADLVGQGRQAQIDAFPGVALALRFKG
jgi:hypothetical protein